MDVLSGLEGTPRLSAAVASQKNVPNRAEGREARAFVLLTDGSQERCLRVLLKDFIAPLRDWLVWAPVTLRPQLAALGVRYRVLSGEPAAAASVLLSTDRVQGVFDLRLAAERCGGLAPEGVHSCWDRLDGKWYVSGFGSVAAMLTQMRRYAIDAPELASARPLMDLKVS